jgi:hypothetical protein
MTLNVVNSPRSAYVFTLCEFSEFAFSCENSYAQTVRTFSTFSRATLSGFPGRKVARASHRGVREGDEKPRA